MYIAFNWLLFMAFAMWIAMCGIDIYVKRHKAGEGYNFSLFGATQNATIKTDATDFIKTSFQFPAETYCNHKSNKQHSFAVLLFVMFGAGALTVSLYNKRIEILLFTRRKFYKLKKSGIIDTLTIYSKETASRACVAVLNFYPILREIGKYFIKKAGNLFKSYKILQKQRINLVLLRKLKEIGEERRNLAQLLITAIHENKNIRTQYQLENMAKNRLARYIESTNKVIKENRSRYVSFQQLYLVTHQENTFLKARLKKLSKEKDDAEKSLLNVINEVYKSKNNELKAFCSRFIVKTKDNLLNSDVSEEIEKFLQRSRKFTISGSRQNSESPAGDSNPTDNWANCINAQFKDIFQDDALTPLVSVAPKLKGLPGEYVWTVKDKDGIIEKLYEYDYESDLDNGETIRRIRQYSVYYDKDCLLDLSSSTTLVGDSNTGYRGWGKQIHVGYPSTSQGFLTGSEAFQKFLNNNKSVASRSPAPPLMCG